MFGQPGSLKSFLTMLPPSLPALDISLDHATENSNEHNPRAFARVILTHFKHVTSLSLCPCADVSCPEIADAIVSLPLKKLVLSHRLFSKALPSNEELHQSGCICGHGEEACPVGFAENLLPRLSSLTHLSLTVQFERAEKPLANFLKSLPASLPLLTHLTLLHNPVSSGEWVNGNASLSELSLLKHLKELTVHFHWPVTDYDQFLPRLTKFSLDYFHPRLPNQISYNIHLFGAAISECAINSNLVDGASFENCTHLNSLVLENIHGNVSIARCPSLETLRCSLFDRENTDWSLSVQNCPSLKSIGFLNERRRRLLRIGGCPNLTSLTVSSADFEFTDMRGSLLSLNIIDPIPFLRAVEIIHQFANLSELKLAIPDTLLLVLNNASLLKRLDITIERPLQLHEPIIFEFGECPLLDELKIDCPDDDRQPALVLRGLETLSRSSRLSKLTLPPTIGLSSEDGLMDLSALTSLNLKSFAAGKFALPLGLTDLNIAQFQVLECCEVFSHPLLERFTLGSIHGTNPESTLEIQCPRLKELIVGSQVGVRLVGLANCSALKVLKLKCPLLWTEAATVLAHNPGLWSMGTLSISHLLSFRYKSHIRSLLKEVNTTPTATPGIGQLSEAKRGFFSAKLNALLKEIGSSPNPRAFCTVCCKCIG